MVSSKALRRIWFAAWSFATLVLILYALQARSFDCLIAINTLGLGICSAGIAVPLGALLAFTCLGNRRLNQTMLFCTAALLAIPVFLHVGVWDAAIGRLGWLASLNGYVLEPVVSGWLAASWVHGLAATPQVAILLWIGMSFGQQETEEQALLDTSRWKVFWHIRLPRLIPLFMLSILWTMVVASREIAATDLYQIGTLAEQIYLGYSLGQFNAIAGGWSAEELAAAAKLNYWLTIYLLIWIAATVGLLCTRWMAQETEIDFAGARSPFLQADVLETASMRRFKNWSSSGLLMLLFGLPLANLMVRGCFYVAQVDGQPLPSYSLEQLGSVLLHSMTRYSREYWWSFLIGATSSTLILVIATIVIWKAKRSRVARTLIALTWIASCTIPGPLIGTLIGSLFQSVDWAWVRYLYDRTIVAPVLANLIFCWPFPPLIVWFIFRNTSTDVIDNARMEGTKEWTIFWRFGISDHLPKLFGCWLVTLAICVGELSASQLVLPPGMDTLPRLMLGLLHSGVDEMTAGITITMISAIGLISLAGWKMIHWSLGR